MHQFPDADAVASSYVIKEIIKRRHPKKNVYVLFNCPEYNFAGPKDLSFGDTPFLKTEDFFKKAPSEGWTVYLIDHSDPSFSILHNGKDKVITESIVVDHHLYYGTAPEGAKLFLDDTAESTCEMLYDYLKEHDFKEMNKKIGAALYVGLFSDNIAFRKPMKIKQFDLIHDLIHGHGVNIEDYRLYVRKEHLLRKKMLGRVLFLHTSKAKNSNLVSVVINNETFQRCKSHFLSMKRINEELFLCPYLDHTLIRYETSKGRGSVRFTTQDEDLVKKGRFDNVSRPNYHVWNLLSEKQAKGICKSIKLKMTRGDAEKEPLNLGDEISKIQIDPEDEEKSLTE